MRAIAIAAWFVILLAGGVFLIYKATTEIHEKLEGADHASVGGAESGGGRALRAVARAPRPGGAFYGLQHVHAGLSRHGGTAGRLPG